MTAEQRTAAIKAFNSAVDAEMARSSVDRDQAIQKVAKKSPSLHTDFLVATNPSSIEERVRKNRI